WRRANASSYSRIKCRGGRVCASALDAPLRFNGYFFFCGSRYIPRASASVGLPEAVVWGVATEALKDLSAASWGLSARVWIQRRTRWRAATLLPEGWAPSNWSLERAKSFSWSLEV